MIFAYRRMSYLVGKTKFARNLHNFGKWSRFLLLGVCYFLVPSCFGKSTQILYFKASGRRQRGLGAATANIGHLLSIPRPWLCFQARPEWITTKCVKFIHWVTFLALFSHGSWGHKLLFSTTEQYIYYVTTTCTWPTFIQKFSVESFRVPPSTCLPLNLDLLLAAPLRSVFSATPWDKQITNKQQTLMLSTSKPCDWSGPTTLSSRHPCPHVPWGVGPAWHAVWARGRH
jgi:hypothetical protein